LVNSKTTYQILSHKFGRYNQFFKKEMTSLFFIDF